MVSKCCVHILSQVMTKKALQVGFIAMRNITCLNYLI